MEDVVTPDAVTVNPMLGLDTLEPFVKTAKDAGKGLFVLVRTSNPGSAELQDVKLADGRTWSEMLADKLAPVAAQEGLLGTSGWSSLGAVVGATQPQTMQSLRRRLPKSIFLLPGYGAQGATADMTRAAFRDGGRARSCRRAGASSTPIGSRSTPSGSGTTGSGAWSRRWWT